MRTIIINQRNERDELLSRPYLERQHKYPMEELLANPSIKLITGPRRVGKSTQALLMLRGRNFAYLNFDDNGLLDKWDEELVMHTLDDVYPGYEYLMLDEVQNLPAWDVWVSKLYRRGKNLVITGSNANLLSSEMATMLTGRYLPIEMLPFSLAEYFAWHNLALDHIPSEEQTKADILQDDYLRKGGYPETIKARAITDSYLTTLFDSIIWKDVVKRHRVRSITDLNNVAVYLLSNFTNPVTYNNVAEDLGIASVNTAKKFMDYLHEPFLFYYLSRYNNKLKLMKRAPQKVYVVDNGFVSSKSFNVSDNLGRLLENQLFIELLRRGYTPEQHLFYYRSRNDKEVDFVVRQGSHIEMLIQVCYDLSNAKTEKREVDSLLECAGELRCDNLYIVTASGSRRIEQDGRRIQVIGVREFATHDFAQG